MAASSAPHTELSACIRGSKPRPSAGTEDVRVVLLDGLNVAVACNRNTVFTAFKLHAQVLEGFVGLQIRIALDSHEQAG